MAVQLILHDYLRIILYMYTNTSLYEQERKIISHTPVFNDRIRKISAILLLVNLEQFDCSASSGFYFEQI